MIYKIRFDAALREIVCTRSTMMQDMAQLLPIDTGKLAEMIGLGKANYWKKIGRSPRHGAILAIASIIEKSKHEYVDGAVVQYLMAALASQAVHNASDAELINAALGYDSPEVRKNVDAISQSVGGVGEIFNNDIKIQDLLCELMTKTLFSWKVMSGTREKTDRWFAITYGLLDSIGQSLGADPVLTLEMMKFVLEVSDINFVMCQAVSRDPAMLSWIILGGQAAHEILTGKQRTPSDVLIELSKKWGASS